MPAPLSPPSAAKDAGRLDFRTRQLERRPVPELIVGPAIYAIEVVENYQPVVVGDDRFNWMIPEDLDEAVLLKVEGYVNTTSSGGDVEVMVTKVPDSGIAVDMLTDKIIIPSGELNSFEPGGEQSIVDPDEEQVVHGDHLRIDVDAAGTDALGLGIILYFIPLRSKALIVQGAKGDPGGIVNWTGEYDSGETYVENDVVSINGSTYVAIVNNPTTTPGVDPGWEAEWMLLVGGDQIKSSAIELALHGNGFVLDIGRKASVLVPFACVITEATLLADVAGDVVVDIWKDTYGAYPPLAADSIVGASPPTLSGAIKTTDTALTGWTTALAENDVLIFNVDSVATIQQLTISLKVDRT